MVHECMKVESLGLICKQLQHMPLRLERDTDAICFKDMVIIAAYMGAGTLPKMNHRNDHIVQFVFNSFLGFCKLYEY